MNPWKTFLQLVSENKKWIGKVILTAGTKVTVDPIPVNGSTTVVDSNGVTYVNNTFVWVEGGTITGQAPNIGSALTQVIF